MWFEKGVRSQTEVETSDRNDFESVVVDSDSDRTAADAVVPVAERLRQCFAQGGRGIQRFVDSLEYAGRDPASHWKAFNQIPLGLVQQGEDVAVSLLVVYKLAPCRTAESGEP